jgi:hypothetical protein
MALPLLPGAHIAGMFRLIEDGLAEDAESLRDLATYVRNTWINGNIWSAVDLSVYKLDIRTNNDVEGWHARLNHRGKRGMYDLID